MKVIIKPKREEKVVASARKDADPKTIRDAVRERAESCVDHLCGCSSYNPSGC